MTLCAPAAGWWQNRPMAIYHLSVKPVQRSAGRSSTAAAAYRAGKKIIDERTGEIHDYRRKSGVEDATIILPPEAPGWAANRAALWNAAEAAEKRKDGTPAREYVVALPAELNAEQVGIRALALMPLPTEKRGEGLAEVAVQIQGVWVRPGDWLYADADGIVVSSQAL